eukprot:scaffold10314_cov55-Cyclotella_meneghiniana.AAC.2
MSQEQLVWAREGSHEGAVQHAGNINHDLNVAEIRWTSTGRIATVPKDHISYELPSRRNRKQGSCSNDIDSGSNNGSASAALSSSLDKSRKKKRNSKATTTIYPIGTAVSKLFTDPETGEERPYSGFVISYDSEFKLYKIRYDEDGDEEEVDMKELEMIIVMETLDDDSWGSSDEEIRATTKKRMRNRNNITSAKKKKPTKVLPATPRDDADAGHNEPVELVTCKSGRKARKVVYYAESSDSDDEIESEGGMPPRKKGKVVTGMRKKKHTDDESDDFMPESEQEEDTNDNDSDFEVESDDEKLKKANKGRNKEAIASAKKDKPKSKKMCDSFKPINNPVFWDKNMTSQQIKEKFTFLDPCGMEATDDIIDRLVGEQLDKIGNLLKKALTMGALGSQNDPLVLGTACSGTDAPALALTIVQQQLEKRGMGDLFKHEHGRYPKVTSMVDIS